MRMSNSKTSLCTAASQGSPSFCASTVIPRYKHTLFILYFPEAPEFLYLHLAAVKQKMPLHHLLPLQQQQLREDSATLPLRRSGETPPGANADWNSCMYKSCSSAPSCDIRSLSNTDCRQIKNRAEGTPLETFAHRTLVITVC